MGNDYILKPVRTAAIVGTSAFVAGTVLENLKFEDEVILLVDFIKGSLTDASIKVEFSPDNSNFYQEVNEVMATGATTYAVVAITHTLDTTGKYRLAPIKIKDRYIKVSTLGTGNGTGSSLTIDAIIGQDN